MQEIIADQAIRALEINGKGLNEKERESFKKVFINICLSENWLKIKKRIHERPELKERESFSYY